MESRGVIICRPPGISKRVDAFSRWFDSRALVVLSDRKHDKARSRFDAAHKLGHLVMHHEPEYSDRVQERQAHAFAAAVLMPAPEAVDDLPTRTPRGAEWDKLEDAQRRWGVSIAALLYRAKDLGTLSDAGFRRAMTRYNQLGLGARDGRALGETEAARLLPEAVKALLAHNGWTYDCFAAELRFTRRQLEAILGPIEDSAKRGARWCSSPPIWPYRQGPGQMDRLPARSNGLLGARGRAAIRSRSIRHTSVPWPKTPSPTRPLPRSAPPSLVVVVQP